MLAQTRYHAEFLQATLFAEVDTQAQAELRALLEEHAARSNSSLARQMLAGWLAASRRFVRMVPLPA